MEEILRNLIKNLADLGYEQGFELIQMATEAPTTTTTETPFKGEKPATNETDWLSSGSYARSQPALMWQYCSKVRIIFYSALNDKNDNLYDSDPTHVDTLAQPNREETTLSPSSYLSERLLIITCFY